jgi:predicted HicB family RNase H-like nuclease
MSFGFVALPWAGFDHMSILGIVSTQIFYLRKKSKAYNLGHEMQQRKPGRPLMPPSLRKSKNLHIRIDQALHDRLIAYASKMGRTASSMILRLIEKEIGCAK